MNLAAFAVIVVRERETDHGDDMASMNGLGADRPVLAWCATIAHARPGRLPGDRQFFGKLYLIDAAVDNDYAWLGVAIVIGSAVSLAYYLRDRGRVGARRGGGGGAAAIAGGRPILAGGAPARRRRAPPVGRGAARVRGGDADRLQRLPEPLFDAARDAGQAISSVM